MPVIMIIILLLILGLVYFSLRKTNKTEPVDTIATEKVQTLTDADFINALGDSEALESKVVARGDVNQDGYEDALVQSMHCGASCGVDLLIVLNDKNTTAKVFEPTDYLGFEPAYRGSGAVKSDLSDITIKDGIISLTGTALGCPEDFCDDENIGIVRRVTYKFDGQKIIQLSVEQL
ncbi:MAG: hypothetical protein UU06_C0020G0012 [Parcubacteria group bacterium GW2011_GWB1_40_5]|nr:MAG: hypothetical protein UU06_C0020G0012 [Parcubacteria group bacterium GW2011_GWB1_40_5]